MKCRIALSILIATSTISLLSGCQSGHKGQKITIEGDGLFPPAVAGIWKTQDGKWEVVFSSKGDIVEAKIPLGDIRLQPGQTIKFEIPRFEGKGEYTAGQWSTFWDQSTNDLSVKVELEHFYQDIGYHAIEGKTTDHIIGSLSDDYETWTAVLYTKAYIETLIFDGWTLVERKNLADDKEPVFRGELIFKKSWSTD